MVPFLIEINRCAKSLSKQREMIDEARLVRIFENLITIYSPSHKERRVADHVKGYIEALGFLAFEDSAGEKIGGEAGNIIVTVPATADGPCVMLSAHMDTVEPSEGIEMVIEGGIIKSKGNTILGADDKVGCAAMLELLSILADKPFPHGPIHLVFTVAEEVGLHGAKALDLSDKSIDFLYNLDSNGAVGTVVISAPYQDSFDVEYKGRAAHAGVSPETGINAIYAAALAISRMKLGRIDEETTANVGKIHGGRAGNIIPDSVSIFAECRSNDFEKLEAQAKHMIEAFKQGADETGAEVFIRRIRPYEGYKVTVDSPIVKRVETAAKAIGVKLSPISSGGGSDTNIFAAKGINAVNLGIGFENVHSEQESIAISELKNLTGLLVELVRA